ncbi:MAG: hypothetical protein Aurels2KO_13710 [Aureliella sp.]
MKKLCIWSAATVCLTLISNSAPLSAAVLYSDPLNDASADVLVLTGADTAATFVDYSNFTVGSTSFQIAEAPNSVGGTATRGLLLQANIAGGAGAAVNVLLGSTPTSFSGDYRLSYDVYMNSTVSVGGSGTTEQTLWGIGVDNNATLEAAINRNGGNTVGTWGWLTSENGSGTEDSAINLNGTELADIGDTDNAASAALFNSAFTNLYGTPNATAAGQWISVEVESLNGNVSVKYNGVEFFNEASAGTTGFAMFGYEDRFGSIATPGDNSWGLYDNIVVTAVPEPSSGLALLSIGGFALLRRRR